MGDTGFLKETVGGKSVVSRIVENITNAIINGEIKPGDKLPTEGELSENMGVGRNSVREAIKILEAYGVVHIKRAEGTFISREYDGRMIYPVLYGIILQKDSMNQIVELRKVIDVGVLTLAIQKLREEDTDSLKMKHIESALKNLELEVRSEKRLAEKIHEADVAFHMAVVESAGNNMLKVICGYVDRITSSSRRTALKQIISEEKLEEFLDMHKRIEELLKEAKAENVLSAVEEHYRYWIRPEDNRKADGGSVIK